jgi:hypothetical protein
MGFPRFRHKRVRVRTGFMRYDSKRSRARRDRRPPTCRALLSGLVSTGTRTPIKLRETCRYG